MLAWGGFPNGYPDQWTVGQTPPTALSTLRTETVTRSSSQTFDTLQDTGVLYIVSVTHNSTTYVQGTSYKLTGNTVDWSIAGSNPVPAANATYTVVYRYTYTAVASLLNEVGRRAALTVGYANADPNGVIVANGSTWTYTTTPSANLYLQFKFDPTDGVGSIISQVGLVIGTVAATGVPNGTQYLTPSNIANAGQLYMIDNLEPFSRFAGKREIFEYIISF
jgi:hypothetical protein